MRSEIEYVCECGCLFSDCEIAATHVEEIHTEAYAFRDLESLEDAIERMISIQQPAGAAEER
jgi:hypothetical protein